MYLFAIIEVYSRYVVVWSLSNTMSAEWCCSVIADAIATHGKPEIINSDQGSQFTSNEYVNLLIINDIKIRWIVVDVLWTTSSLNDCGGV